MAAPTPSIFRTLGWGAYLGVSWTWCIGMFLPVLLMRDFGVWAFGVFAIPNVVGAAAMGWVLRTRASSESLVAEHRTACGLFSAVTIAFHLSVLVWLSSLVDELDARSRWLVGAALLGGLLGALPAAARRVWLVSPVLFFVASLLAAGNYVMGDRLAEARYLGVPGSHGMYPATQLAWLAPVCVFGFALCPYLDLTFHRARQAFDTRRAGVAFGVGFGVFFFAMILFTLLYARTIISGYAGAVGAAILLPVVLHFVAQASFTCVVHAGEVCRLDGRRRVVAMAGGVVLAAAGYMMSGTRDPLADVASGVMTLGETMYRGFMAFYGLAFPAYAWLCMLPTRDGHAGLGGARGRRKLIVWCAAVALATPCYWMGFIERETWWLAPGLGIVLAARVLVLARRGARVEDGAGLRRGV